MKLSWLLRAAWCVLALLTGSCTMQQTAAQAVLAAPQESPAARNNGNSVNSGTGFFISKDGYVVSVYHVIKDKPVVMVRMHGQPGWRAAKVVKFDADNDLALLKADVVSQPLALARWEGVPIGLEAFVVGFPLPRVQGPSVKMTQGIVNGEAARGKSSRLFQLSAEVQKGNSGGPVLAPDGLVIGVIQSKLNAMSVAQKTNDLPQNVNFALKSNVLQNFLADTPAKVELQLLNISLWRRPYEVMRDAMGSVVMVVAGDKPMPVVAAD